MIDKFEKDGFTTNMLSDGATYWARKGIDGSFCIGIKRLHMISGSDITIYITFDDQAFDTRRKYITETNLIVLRYNERNAMNVFDILSATTSTTVISDLESLAEDVEKGVVIEP